eukprot:CAMPEP_0181396654 /NCGR_PEP_ID=MMETSP1110-20121109/23_1 /TAXON_ID=174948 /ORGANISM="Symbiodinium sp., Strain CCMP421" /LENGTH=99 /DNA_ID=CAMNT_0023518353 /DNA_START=607 /DNA_END=906 /DNA_ORIENTATION=-
MGQRLHGCDSVYLTPKPRRHKFGAASVDPYQGHHQMPVFALGDPVCDSSLGIVADLVNGYALSLARLSLAPRRYALLEPLRCGNLRFAAILACLSGNYV